VSDGRCGFWRHKYFAPSNCATVRWLFGSDVYHAGMTHGVEMAKGGFRHAQSVQGIPRLAYLANNAT